MSMSAADWTRMQRRKAGTKYMSDANKPARVAPDLRPEERLCPVGGSRIRRTATDYTNFVASSLEDYVLKSTGTGRSGETVENTGAAKLAVRMIGRGAGCSCTTTLGITLPKTGICSTCGVVQQVRIK